MLAHVVIDLDVVAREGEVAVEFHLFAGDARTLRDGVLNGLAVGERESLHFVDILALVGDGCVEDGLCHGDEVGSIGNEVGLALHGDHCGKAFDGLDEYTTIRGLAVGTLGGNGQSALAQQVLCFVEVSLGLGQCFLHVGKACTGHGAELLDIFHTYLVSHSFFKLKINN